MRNHKLFRGVLAAAALVLLSSGVSVASASDSFGSWGSSGGSSGWGSSGGGYASSGGGRAGLFGGSHGGPVRNLFGRVRDHFSDFRNRGSSGGSSGGWSSSGGSHGTWGSSGYVVAHGSSGGWGSSGGSTGFGSSGGSNGFGSSGGSTGHYSGQMMGNGFSYSQPVDSFSAPYYDSGVIQNSVGYPVYSQPGTVVQPQVQPQTQPGTGNNAVPQVPQSGEQTPSPAPANGGSGASIENSTEAVITLMVPEDSKVFVNGKPTKATGGVRNFVARRLVPGKSYPFEVKVVWNQDGREQTRTEYLTAVAGDRRELAVDFTKEPEVMTTLSVRVPTDAKVILAGTPSQQTGDVRVFSTSALKSGESWDNYKIVVEVERNGQVVTEEKTLKVVAGETYQINFDLNGSTTRVAAR